MQNIKNLVKEFNSNQSVFMAHLKILDGEISIKFTQEGEGVIPVWISAVKNQSAYQKVRERGAYVNIFKAEFDGEYIAQEYSKAESLEEAACEFFNSTEKCAFIQDVLKQKGLTCG